MKVKVNSLKIFEYNDQVHIGVINNNLNRIKSLKTDEIFEIEEIKKNGSILNITVILDHMRGWYNLSNIIFNTESREFKKFVTKIEKQYNVYSKAFAKMKEKSKKREEIERKLKDERNF